MVTSTKRNEHPRCSCRMCRLGASSNAGQYTHRRVNRAIRRKYKQALRAVNLDDSPVIIVSTGYTD